MKVIYKYTLNIQFKEQSLALPYGAQILSIQSQNGTITMWVHQASATINPETTTLQNRTFRIIATGQEFSDTNLMFLATVQVYSFVWHIFEVIT